MKALPSHVLLLGLGRATYPLVEFLLGRHVPFAVYDEDEAAFQRHPEVRRFRTTDLAGADRHSLAVTSPGFAETSAAIVTLRGRGLHIVDEVDFTARYIQAPIVAVTGTNGKSTTTALIGRILAADHRRTFFGGNLAPGLPFAQALLEPARDIYVVEVSSFQLERCPTFAPHVACLLNVTPDHLDRHPDFDRYRALKLGIFAHQRVKDFAVINHDDPALRAAAAGLKSQVFFFSLAEPVTGAYLVEDRLFFRDEEVADTSSIHLPGRHNVANVLAALCATKLLGVANASFVRGVEEFAGLEHRLELVAIRDGVQYINNSMCTNPAAAVASLEAFPAPVILIAGGHEKNLPLETVLEAFRTRTRLIILFGENRDRLAAALADHAITHYETASSLEDALARARRRARPGDVVLFSPGFASFGDYRDFLARGKAFKDAVQRL